MAKAKVFISGMDALGVEIAKNVALAGVKKLTVHDIKVAKPLDLTNYYLTATNVSNGDNRAVASALKLNELNRYTSRFCSEKFTIVLTRHHQYIYELLFHSPSQKTELFPANRTKFAQIHTC